MILLSLTWKSNHNRLLPFSASIISHPITIILRFIPIAVGVMMEEYDTLGAEGDYLMTIILHEKMRSVGVQY